MDRLTKGILAAGAVVAGGWLLKRALRGPNYDFRGKVALVTGGSRGLGLVIARRLADEGARVAVCARDPEELDRAGDDLAGHGGWPLALPCDVTEPGKVADMVRAVEAHFGPVDVLINNAGVIGVGPAEVMTREDFEYAMNINFWGAYNTVEAVLPSMRERKEGRIVNISSIGGKVSVPHLLPYTASKFALTGYSHGLRAELAKDGIVVTTVCPGLMRTGSPRNADFKGSHEEEYAWFSIGDSLPLLTISAETAARRILAACRQGDAEAMLSLPAWLADRVNTLFPELSAGLRTLTNRLLPETGTEGDETRKGSESESDAAPSWATTLGDKAARRNNEMG
jgi:NAD(P)-dependent dehydrogenase (short-subunit alcohol dehydrogenase family)